MQAELKAILPFVELLDNKLSEGAVVLSVQKLDKRLTALTEVGHVDEVRTAETTRV